MLVAQRRSRLAKQAVTRSVRPRPRLDSITPTATSLRPTDSSDSSLITLARNSQRKHPALFIVYCLHTTLRRCRHPSPARSPAFSTQLPPPFASPGSRVLRPRPRAASRRKIAGRRPSCLPWWPRRLTSPIREANTTTAGLLQSQRVRRHPLQVEAAYSGTQKDRPQRTRTPASYSGRHK